MEIINLNGVEYIKRDKVKNMEAELKAMKEIMGQINKLTDNKIDGSITRHKRNNKRKDAVFELPKSAQKKYEIRMMNDKGVFITAYHNKKLKITIKDVILAKKGIYDGMTTSQAFAIRDELGLNNYHFNRLVYNIKEGVFDKFIKQWNKQTGVKVGKKEVPIENNPQKRKESGIYV